MGIFGVPLSSERGQVAVEIVAVHNLPVTGLINAVQVVPHSHAVVNAGAHQLAACLGAEVCRVHQARMFQARQLTDAGHSFPCMGDACQQVACCN